MAGLRLDHLAAVLIAGRPLEPFAEGLFGWALAQAVSGGGGDAYEALAWVVRLNPIDWAATVATVHKLTADINNTSSEAMKRGAAIILDLLGDRCSSDRSSLLQPRREGGHWRSVETFCDTNPHDPDAPPGSNLENARNALAAIVPIDTWASMSLTLADHQLESLTPALARFDRSIIVGVLREVVATAPHRTAMRFRQLSWRMVELSPIFDRSVLSAVREAYDLLLAHPELVCPADGNWVASSLVRAMTPHFSSQDQLDLLLSLPNDCPLYLNLRNALLPLPADVLEKRLMTARDEGSSRDLARILYFASGSKPALTQGSRLIIAGYFNDNCRAISISAADVIYMADDPELYDLVLEQSIARDIRGTEPYELSLRSRAIAAAVVGRSREDLIKLIPPRTLDWVAAQMGGPALDLLAEYIEHIIRRLLRPVAAMAPQDLTAFLEASEDGLDEIGRVEEKSERSATTPRDVQSAFRDFSDALDNPDEANRRFSQRQKLMIEELQAYERAITQEGATEMLTAPPRKVLNELVRRDPTRIGSWIASILAVREPRALGQIRNLGLSLASSYSAHDPEKASDLFRHLKDRATSMNVVIGHEAIPFYEYALFKSADAEPIVTLREDVVDAALDDAELEMVTVAAEVCGAGDWLGRYVEELAASNLPVAQARALTIAGFRQPNDSSRRILDENWGDGFLGHAAAVAKECYQRAIWAQHWLEEAAKAKDPLEFWRFATLAKAVVDIRFVLLFRRQPSTELLRRYGADLHERLRTAAKERSKKRRDTLFGIKAPGQDLTMSLCGSFLPTNHQGRFA